MLCTRSIIRSSGGPALAGRIRTSVAAGIGSGRSDISATSARTAAVEVPCSAPDHPFRLHDTIESGFVDQLQLQPGLLERQAMLMRIFRDLGGIIVADLGRKRGDQHQRTIQQVGNASLVGLQSRSEEHTSELQSLMRISYAVFCLKKKNTNTNNNNN